MESRRDATDAQLTSEEILAKAADLVEFSGTWGQGDEAVALGHSVCVMIALNDVAGNAARKSYVVAECALLKEIGAAHIVEAMDWNDFPGRTKEEVATALRNAKRWL